MVSIDQDLLDYIEQEESVKHSSPEEVEQPIEETMDKKSVVESIAPPPTIRTEAFVEEKQGVFTLISNTIIGIVYDLYNFNIDFDLFTKNDRMQGIIYLLVMCVIYIISKEED